MPDLRNFYYLPARKAESIDTPENMDFKKSAKMIVDAGD